MFERIDGQLNAFTTRSAPQESDLDDLENANAQAYDLVLNGHELGGGQSG